MLEFSRLQYITVVEKRRRYLPGCHFWKGCPLHGRYDPHMYSSIEESERGTLCSVSGEKATVFRQAYSEKHPGGWSVLPRRRHIQSGDYSMIPRSPDYPSCCLPEYFF